MSGVSDRLKAARLAAGYATAKEAAAAMGVPQATYNHAEGGLRALTADKAIRYARFFKTSPEWLLYGKKALATEPTVDDLEFMLRDALSELVTLDTKIADLPRILAPSLHEQIALFRADREGRAASAPSSAGD